MILEISICAPGINNHFSAKNFDSFLVNFSIFLNTIKEYPEDDKNYSLIPDNQINSFVNDFFDFRLETGINITIFKRIPPEFILKYDYL